MTNSHVDQEGLSWIYPDLDQEWHQKIINEFKIHPVTAQVLVSRGFRDVDEIHNYLYAKLPNLLNPRLFPDMDKAVERIISALKNHESILVCGDNDVDGITATALLTEFLNFLGIKTIPFVTGNIVPHSTIYDAVEYARAQECNLIITVDCGISSVDEIRKAKEYGIETIVTDHHEPMVELPNCLAILNPKVGTNYPNRELTGVGVAFKLAHGVANFILAHNILDHGEIDLKKYLDLVALGTVADMGSLLGENRILVRYGLYQLRKTYRIGLYHLLKICDLEPENVTSSDIASKIAPRLNSLGRIDDPQKGVQLLLTKDHITAEKLAKELEHNNLERQKIERRDFETIEDLLKKNQDLLKNKALVIFSEKFHPGIVPILTTRLTKLYNRPVIVIALDKGIGKGSIRTIPEFPLLPTLKENANFLLNFGGHDFAAGFSIKEENIDKFKHNFIEEANKNLKDPDIMAKLYLDGSVSFKDLSFEFLESMNLLEPFGNENPPPIFYSQTKQTWIPKIVGKMHLKFYLENDERTLEGIGFGMAPRRIQLRKKNTSLLVAFTPQINTFLNKTSIQLQIKDFRII